MNTEEQKITVGDLIAMLRAYPNDDEIEIQVFETNSGELIDSTSAIGIVEPIIRKAYGFRNIQNLMDMVYLVCSNIRVPLPNRKPEVVKSA